MTRQKAVGQRAGPSIEIVGATANNLKGVSVRFPGDAVTMIVGPSGSGKSSLLADTLAAEADRRLKTFLDISQEHLEGGDVQAFVGTLPACIHFAQGAFRASQRTTVGTCSGLLSAVRRLFLRHSVPWSDRTGEPVPSASPESYGAWLANHYRGRLTVSAVPLRGVASNGMEEAKTLLGLGFKMAVLRSETDSSAAMETGQAVQLEGFKPLNANRRHVLEVEVGTRCLPEEDGLSGLLVRAFAAAGRGSVVIELHDRDGEFACLQGARGTLIDSDLHRLHPMDAMVFAPPSEPLLSFNMPGSERSGACPECRGTGQVLQVAEDVLVAHPERSVHNGALSLWTEKNYKYVNIQHETIEGLRGLHGFDPDIPWSTLPPRARTLILHGSQGTKVRDRDPRTGRQLNAARAFEGLIPAILNRAAKGSASAQKLAHMVREEACPGCRGSRWSPQARALRVGGLGLAELLAADFTALADLTEPGGHLAMGIPRPGAVQVALVHHMATSFIQVGLGHLSGDRGMLTLSEGEARRVRLAGVLEAPGRGLGLLLDEPARGLHEADIARLVGSLERLKKRHTVILNDHRLSLSDAADLIVALGPGPGDDGGRIVFNGPPAVAVGADGTDRMHRSPLPVPNNHPSLEIRGGVLHTLQNVDTLIPLGRLVAVTGVSGSGKSNFVRGLLVPALRAQLGDRVSLEDFALRGQGSWEILTGAERIEAVLALDQKGAEGNRRSLVATFLDIADTVRKAFASLPEARRLGFVAADFGLNGGRGRCPNCLGLGEREDPGGWVPCVRCGGLRYDQQVLAVGMAGMNIAEVLDAPLSEIGRSGLPFVHAIAGLVTLLTELDLGYISLGRRVDRLSGGEVQRLRIADRLWKGTTRGLFLILDEPSAGLHPSDVTRLLGVLNRIVSGGDNTVVMVEHNIDLIRACDWVLDFGPGGGPSGGRLIGHGPPAHIESLATATGNALRRPSHFGGSHSRSNIRSSLRMNVLGDQPRDVDPASARAARSWLRLLLGHESTLPSGVQDDPDNVGGLAVEVDDAALTRCRPLEIGSLDIELARFILDSRRPLADAVEDLLQIWAKTSEAHLAIQPLLVELQIWGSGIPGSAVRQANARIDALGLVLLPQTDPLSIRAIGPRFEPDAFNPDGCRRAISDALVLGGGYAELLDSHGRVLGAVGSRWLDLKESVVAPMALPSIALSRLHRLGSCPACTGTGSVSTFNLDLVLASREVGLDSDRLYTPEALAILKGVRRNAMKPFFRRLAQEDLWDPSKHFDRLTPPEIDVFLYGYWNRPGAGSFLKDSRSDPQDVGSWLRWSGLVSNVLEQAERSSKPSWKAALNNSIWARECPVCHGSGLARHSRAVQFDGRSLEEWILRGRIGELCDSLRRWSSVTDRQRRTLDRLVHCLEPAALQRPELALRENIGDQVLAREIYERVVGSFTSLGIVK